MAEAHESINTYIKTLGCKVNSYDSAMLEKEFERNGHTIVKQHKEAELLIINSCSVTASAEKEARYLLRKFKRENPKAYRVITGCYAQIASGDLKDLETADYIVPNQQKSKLVSLVSSALSSSKGETKLPDETKEIRNNKQSQFKLDEVLFGSHKISQTRAYIKVQDGCNSFCAYCQIPYARGSSKSVPSSAILAQIENLIADGITELVLTGIDIGDYGLDLTEDKNEDCYTFEKLVEKILVTPKLKRLRISSMEPQSMTESFVKLLEKHKSVFCDHFHLPLQSGSKRILTLMGRSYTKDFYLKATKTIRASFPRALISADVIPGFPGETEEEFQETFDFIKSCNLSSLHVFPYSKRPNTRALRMPNHVEQSDVLKRAKILRELSSKKEEEFAKSFIGKKLSVLWEKSKGENSIGKSKNYLAVQSTEKEKIPAGLLSDVVVKSYCSTSKRLLVKPLNAYSSQS